MNNLIMNCLYEKQNRRFQQLNDLVRQFTSAYCGNSIIRDNIFTVIENYARKNELNLEILRYPIYDEELWAMTFLKQGTIFVYVNSGLELCKQFFAAAHELYHIYCYAENADQSYIKNGSMLDTDTANETGNNQEDLEANAFAGLLLMQDQRLQEQISLYEIENNVSDIDGILTLMEMFAIPYKAVVLRLYESRFISKKQADFLLETEGTKVAKRIVLTGKAKRWQLDGRGTEAFGTLFEKFDYNIQHEYLTYTREKEDSEYIANLKKKYRLG